MLSENVCKFVQNRPAPDVVKTLNFIYETRAADSAALKFDSVYKVYCVSSGKGWLNTPYSSTVLEEGDVLFTFPSTQYSITSADDLKYYYISFLGLRANMLMDRTGINKNNCFFPNKNREILKVWQKFFDMSDSANLDMISESTFLYTLSAIEQRAPEKENFEKSKHTAMCIKQFIDENIQNPGLNLDLISQACAFNKNYISDVFKKNMGITVVKYINTVRVQAACELMKKNITCIKDIAFMCGFNDSLYFSKLFKKQVGLSPREFLAQLGSGEYM